MTDTEFNATPPTTNSSSSSGEKGVFSAGALLYFGIACVGVLLVAAMCAIFAFAGRRKRRRPEGSTELAELGVRLRDVEGAGEAAHLANPLLNPRTNQLSVSSLKDFRRTFFAMTRLGNEPALGSDVRWETNPIVNSGEEALFAAGPSAARNGHRSSSQLVTNPLGPGVQGETNPIVNSGEEALFFAAGPSAARNSHRSSQLVTNPLGPGVQGETSPIVNSGEEALFAAGSSAARNGHRSSQLVTNPLIGLP